jgi:hypothetical protein
MRARRQRVKSDRIISDCNAMNKNTPWWILVVLGLGGDLIGRLLDLGVIGSMIGVGGPANYTFAGRRWRGYLNPKVTD